MLEARLFRQAQRLCMPMVSLRIAISLINLTNLVAIIRCELNGWAAWRVYGRTS